MAIAQFRALGYRYTRGRILGASEHALGVAPIAVGMPRRRKGYSDDTPDWLNPDGMTLRLDTALRSAGSTASASRATPVALGDELFDRALSAATRERIAGAGDDDATRSTILFSSPEFQRR